MAKRTAPRKAAGKAAPRRRKPVPTEPIDLGTEEALRKALHPVSVPPAPEVEAVEYQNVGILRKGWSDFKRTLREASQFGALRGTTYGLTPVLTLGFLSMVRGFDSRIFGLVLPDIVQDLDLNLINYFVVESLAGFIIIFVALGLAYVLDRVRRVPFVVGGTILNAVSGLVRPHVRTVTPLAALNTTDLIGYNLSITPDTSLLNDYYPPSMRGRAFALLGVLYRIGYYTAPLGIGYLAINYGWRSPFYISAPLLLVLGIAVFFLLKEPVRGYMERRELGLSEKEANRPEPPPSFGHAWRTIWGIRTMRRLFLAEIAERVGDRLYGIAFGFFLFEEYGFDVFDRGKLFTLIGLVSLMGGFIGGGLVDSLMRRRPQRVLVISGLFYSVLGISISVVALKPPIWLFLVFNVAYGFGLALTGPAREVFKGQILPAHVRTLGTMVTFLGAVPAIIIAQPFIFRLNDWGFGGVLFAAGPFYIAMGALYASASGFFDRDRRAALASQLASAEYRRAKEAEELKLLVCRDVDVSYDGVQVLFGVDFDVDDGEIVALLGTNGAGKSTLLRAISGSHGASNGAIVYDGREITYLPAHEVAGRGIAHAPGGRGIFPSLTVRENLELSRWLHTHKAGGDNIDTDPSPLSGIDLDEILEIFPALKDRMSTPGGALSGGEQQMVSLAQAFLARPRLLMIDELSLGLSPGVVQELLECVRRIHKRGVTIIVVEQSVNVALTIAERAVFMEKGEVKFIGPTRDLLRRPDILRAVYVKGTGAHTSAPDTARTDKRRREAMEDARPVLEVQDLSKSFGGVTAVDDVSFVLREGEVLGLIGPNGAGKTTIFDLISGYLKPDAGRVVYDGNDVTTMGPDERARLQLVRRFQDARLFPSLTLYETLLVALDRRHQARNMILAAVQAPQARQSERRLRSRADQLIALLELGAYRDKFVKELSTGLRRITDIACTLASEPKVLLLDEPSSGIAQAEAESLGPLLRRIRVETGCSILIIEHDMPLISRVADELLALDQGRIVTRGSPDDVLNDKRVIESYLGTSEASIKRSGVLT